MNRKFLWRKVESRNPDQLEFHQGGEDLQFWLGIFYIGWALLFCAGAGNFLEVFFSKVLHEFHTAQAAKVGFVRYWELKLAFLQIVCGMYAVLVCLLMAQGLWMAFGKARLTVNCATRELQTHFQLFQWTRETSFDARDVMYISVGPGSVVQRLLSLHGIYLHSQARGRQQFLTVYWKKLQQGRELAQQIAAFLGIPGPLDSANCRALRPPGSKPAWRSPRNPKGIVRNSPPAPRPPGRL